VIWGAGCLTLRWLWEYHSLTGSGTVVDVTVWLFWCECVSDLMVQGFHDVVNYSNVETSS